MWIPRLAFVLLLSNAGMLLAQVRVNPTGVNVNTQGATSVYLTYGGLRANVRPAEAYWCGELVSAAPDIGNRCNPATIFGSLPPRYDLSRSSGSAGFTDIMSIPASVSRRAYQDARAGATSSFFYVRRFENLAGGPDEFVSVTCRLSAGGARTPFALTDVRVAFEGGDEVQFVAAGDSPPTFSARIQHTGTGQLVGRWEVVLPGEELPSEEDLLTEASLPPELRSTQRRYAQVSRFSVFVPPGGVVRLPGPDPAMWPISALGTYHLLLLIAASNDREGDSDLGAAGAGTGIVHSAAVAGFPMPILRYVVLGDGSPTTTRGTERFVLLAPRDGGTVRPDSSARLVWSRDPAAAFYRVELETLVGQPVHGALLKAPSNGYDLPPFAWQKPDSILRWRVTAIDGGNATLRRTAWRRITLPAASRSTGSPP